MTITQTLDKLEEHLAGIIPAFIMLGVVVFLLLGLGAAVAPASAIVVPEIYEGVDGVAGHEVEYYTVGSVGLSIYVQNIDYGGYSTGDLDFSFEFGAYFEGERLPDVGYPDGENIEFTDSSLVFCKISITIPAFSTSYSGSDDYLNSYVKLLSSSNPDCIVYYGGLQNAQVFYFTLYVVPLGLTSPDEPSGEGFNFDCDYNKETDDYTVSLKRNGEPWYLSIKGKAFGWIPVYTYTSVTLEDIEFDTYLSGLPSRFLMFDIDYVAEVYKAGSGTTDSTDKFYYYSWTRSEFVDEEGNLLDPDVIGTEGEKIDFDSLVDPPEFVEDKGYDVPPIGDLDEDGIHNKDDDDLDGDGIPNEEDDEPYNPYNNGILGSLGFTPDVSLPDIESITDMMRNMKFPASLKEMFNIPLPDEYKAGIAVEEGHVLYGYQQLWFGLGDGVIGLFMGIIFVIAALIACIPRFLFEFFSSLIEWLNVAFQSFYDWLVIPSEIFKLVIGLLPDELLAIALLLFGIDLVFLFFRFVIPGLISGSRAVGDIVQKEEEIRSYEDENHGKRRYK